MGAADFARNVVGAVEAFANGDYIGGAVNTAFAILGARNYAKACFAKGTPIWTAEGHRPVEEIRTGELVAARNEHDPHGPIEFKPVLQTFVRQAAVLHLHLAAAGGPLVIGTTAEHPFFAHGRGWVDAGELEVGDWLLTATGRWLMVEEVHDTGEVQTVYNFEVADHHTYFVGTPDWPALVWVHNAKDYVKARDPRKRTGYDPGAPHDDHTVAKVFGGTATRRIPAAMNLRKGGLEGELRRYEKYLIRNGMDPDLAKKVIQDEIDSLARDVIAAPISKVFRRGIPFNVPGL